MGSFSIRPLTPHTGAEVVGLDFTELVEPEACATLNRAFADHHVLVMRDQHFTTDQFKVAAQVFGELQIHDKKEHHVPGHPDVYYVSNDEIVNHDATSLTDHRPCTGRAAVRSGARRSRVPAAAG